MSGVVVTRKHLFTIPGFSTRPGFCRGQSRAWAAQYGIDWRTFLRDGVEADVLLASGDAFAIALVDWASQCEEKVVSRG